MSGIVSAFQSGAIGVGRVLLDVYRRGGRAMVVAPVLVAIAVVPEFIQHVVEISLGMFTSMESARSLASSDLRWGFGYAKIAGYVAAILMIARFWALGSVGKALAIAPRTLAMAALAIGLSVLAELPFNALEAMAFPPVVDIAIRIVGLVVQLGLVVYIVAQLLDDRSMTLRRIFLERLPTVVVMIIALAAAHYPSSFLHSANHKLAIGQPEVLVWGLMAFDALVVGLMAALIGSALFVAYRSGASWRGWAKETVQA